MKGKVGILVVIIILMVMLFGCANVSAGEPEITFRRTPYHVGDVAKVVWDCYPWSHETDARTITAWIDGVEVYSDQLSLEDDGWSSSSGEESFVTTLSGPLYAELECSDGSGSFRIYGYADETTTVHPSCVTNPDHPSCDTDNGNASEASVLLSLGVLGVIIVVVILAVIVYLMKQKRKIQPPEEQPPPRQ